MPSKENLNQGEKHLEPKFFKMLTALADSGNNEEDRAFLRKNFPDLFEDENVGVQKSEEQGSPAHILSIESEIEEEDLPEVKLAIKELKSLLLETQKTLEEVRSLADQNNELVLSKEEKNKGQKGITEENEAILSHRLRMLERHQGNLKNELLKNQNALNELNEEKEPKKNRMVLYGLLVLGLVAGALALNQLLNTNAFETDNQDAAKQEVLPELVDDANADDEILFEEKEKSSAELLVKEEGIAAKTNPKNSVNQMTTKKAEIKKADIKKATDPIVTSSKEIKAASKVVAVSKANSSKEQKLKSAKPKKQKLVAATKVVEPKKKREKSPAELYYERLAKEKAATQSSKSAKSSMVTKPNDKPVQPSARSNSSATSSSKTSTSSSNSSRSNTAKKEKKPDVYFGKSK